MKKKNTSLSEMTQKICGISINENFMSGMSPIEKVKNDINYQTDGPLTEFVAISRAIRAAYARRASPDDISNALSEVLDELKGAGGSLPSREFPQQ